MGRALLVRYLLTRDETGRSLVARADRALIRSAIDTNPTRYTPAITQSCSAIIIPLQLLPFLLRNPGIAPCSYSRLRHAKRKS